jgi:UDP-N-acetylmuramate dehydrogenase
MAVRLLERASLRALNTFGVEARARLLIQVNAPDDLDEALAAAAQHSVRLVLGGGSNLLFTRDFEGAILHLRTRGRRVLDDDGAQAVVEAEAGEPWDAFVQWTLAQGLFGLENLSLIPGTVGASPIQNIGAYGLEMRERFEGLTAVGLTDGRCRDFAPRDCSFGYRDSVFRRAEAGRWLIARVRFRLSRTPDLRTGYADVRDALGADAHPTPQAVAQAVRAIRQRKLPDPALIGNAGSFFKNPSVDTEAARRLLDTHPTLPHWPTGDRVRLSAAWMIDQCGWKGFREGDAGVHVAQALVLVNHGAASGAQLLALSERIRDSVLTRFGIALEPEPLIL